MKLAVRLINGHVFERLPHSPIKRRYKKGTSGYYINKAAKQWNWRVCHGGKELLFRNLKEAKEWAEENPPEQSLTE